MRDRLPAPGKENRVRIVQDNGQAIEGRLEYADDATQEGSAYTKGNVLPDDVCSLLGLDPETAEPKDAFSTLSDMSLWGKYFCILYFLYNGSPVSGFVVEIQGKAYTADEHGVIKMFSTGPDLEFSVSGYADVSNSQFSFTCNEGTVSSFSVELQTIDYFETSTSVLIRLSSMCSRLDVCAVGAGGGGGAANKYAGPIASFGQGAGGGGAGECKVELDVPFTPNNEYQVVIGAGGHGGTFSSSDGYGGYGAPGGDSSAVGVLARGGDGGGRAGNGVGTYFNIGSGGSGYPSGGSGVNSKGQGSPGSDSQGNYFTSVNTETKSGGSGGGGACNGTSNTSTSSFDNSSGGLSGGGYGAGCSATTGRSGGDGTVPGAGGGGASAGSGEAITTWHNGGDGYRGIVCFRMYH